MSNHGDASHQIVGRGGRRGWSTPNKRPSASEGTTLHLSCCEWHDCSACEKLAPRELRELEHGHPSMRRVGGDATCIPRRLATNAVKARDFHDKQGRQLSGGEESWHTTTKSQGKRKKQVRVYGRSIHGRDGSTRIAGKVQARSSLVVHMIQGE